MSGIKYILLFGNIIKILNKINFLEEMFFIFYQEMIILFMQF